MRKVGNIAPLSIYNRLRQFGEFYQDNMWSISASEASGVLEAFRTAYDLIAEEDRRTGINTCKGYCKEYGTRCVAVGRDEFNSALREATNAIRRNSTVKNEGNGFAAVETVK